MHFLIPPPAEKSTVHDPSFGADIAYGREEGLHEGGHVVEPLVLSDLFLCEAAIVVGMEAGKCQSVADRQDFIDIGRTNVDSSMMSQLVPKLYHAQPFRRTKVLSLRISFSPTAILFQPGPHIQKVCIGLCTIEPYQDCEVGP